MDELMQKLTPSLRKYALPLSFGILGLILLGYGLIASFAANKNQDEIIFTSAEENKKEVKSAEAKKEITIDISGAVNEPGVYQLTEGSRIRDALEKAGGLSSEADTEIVARFFNLAAKLQDGSKVYVPKVGEGIGSTADNGSSIYSINSGQAGNTSLNTNGLININIASESELDTLPGIGPVTAQKIIDNRPYTTIEELLEKKVVSNSVFEKIKDRIAVY